MRKICSVLIFFLAANQCYSQQIASDTSASAVSIAPVKYFYDAKRGTESAIYNGILYYSYSSLIEGNAFYKIDAWKQGNILYDDVIYNDIWMKYETVADQLIVTADTSTGVFISLFRQRVKEFSYAGMQFIRLEKKTDRNVPETGYYQILVKGKLTAYERNVKTLKEIIDGTTLIRRFEEKIRYHVEKDGKFYSIGNKKDLLSLCKDHKKEIQQFISTNKIKFRKNLEPAITAVTAFYNRL